MQNSSPIQDLTKRELDVLRLMSQALSNQDISEELNISVETVRTHAKRIYSKLNVSGRQEASFRAIELGLVKSDSFEPKHITTPIPVSLDIFIGRKTELHDLQAIFRRGDRLVTVLGAGGMGKTRLAIQYAHEHVADYSDGVYFIPLETVNSVDNIVLQIIDCLPFRISQQTTPEKQLLKYLENKHMLLVVDNWEHLLEGSLILTKILQKAPRVHIIATSRERLHLHNEVLYRLEGLSFPQWETIQDALQYDAVQLLSLTAKRVKPNWDLENASLKSIHDLCVLTQGMPLGIILAAGWLDVYSLDRIVNEIQQNTDFLESNLRDLPHRHRSIRAVFEWTWGLLLQSERDVFMKLSVFRNGCTVDAAEKIAGASPRTLQALINKTLIYRDINGRYVLHELLRQYGEEQLSQSEVIEQQTRDAYARYYSQLAEDIMNNCIPAFEGELDLENLYMAWYWLVDSMHLELLWRCVNSYGMIAYQFGAFSEMRIIFDYAVNKLNTLPKIQPTLYSSLLSVRAAIYAYLVDWDMVYQDIEYAEHLVPEIDWHSAPLEFIYSQYHHGLALRNQNHHKSLQIMHHIEVTLQERDLTDDAVAMTMLAYVYAQQAILSEYIGDLEQSKQNAIRALEHARNIKQKAIIALSTGMLGSIELGGQNYKQAAEYFEECETMYRDMIPTFDFGKVLSEAGTTALAQKDYPKARRYLLEALRILSGYGLLHLTVYLICTVARWMEQENDLEGATMLVAYCKKHSTFNRYTSQIDELLTNLNRKLSPDTYQKAVIQGETVEHEAIIREMNVWLED